MDRFEAMSMLLATVEAGSLSGAGRKLGIPLPTVSRKITDLEAHLGARLLVRTTRRLTLTDAGAVYVEASRQILELLGEAERAATGEYSTPKGDLVLTAPIVFGRQHVLPLVTGFLSSYPEINVRLILSDRNAHLVDDQIDMAVRIGVLPDSGMVATRIAATRSVVCGSPAYLARHGTPATPREVSAHACVTHDFVGPANSWSFRQPGAKAEFTVPVQARLSVTTAEAAIDAAIAGVGLTRLLCYQTVPAVARDALRIVLGEFETEPLPISILHAGRGAMPLKMRCFLDFATPRLRAALSQIPSQVQASLPTTGR